MDLTGGKWIMFKMKAAILGAHLRLSEGFVSCSNGGLQPIIFWAAWMTRQWLQLLAGRQADSIAAQLFSMFVAGKRQKNVEG